MPDGVPRDDGDNGEVDVDDEDLGRHVTVLVQADNKPILIGMYVQ